MSDWIKTAKVGDKVVFVDGKRLLCVFGEKTPIIGAVYTIRDFDSQGDRVGVRLEEIVNDKFHYIQGFGECSFRADRFRPVQPRKTDISQFQALLKSTPTHKPVREDA